MAAKYWRFSKESGPDKKVNCSAEKNVRYMGLLSIESWIVFIG